MEATGPICARAAPHQAQSTSGKGNGCPGTGPHLREDLEQLRLRDLAVQVTHVQRAVVRRSGLTGGAVQARGGGRRSDCGGHRRCSWGSQTCVCNGFFGARRLLLREMLPFFWWYPSKRESLFWYKGVKLTLHRVLLTQPCAVVLVLKRGRLLGEAACDCGPAGFAEQVQSSQAWRRMKLRTWTR